MTKMVQLIENICREFPYSEPVLVRYKNCKSDFVLFRKCKKYRKDRNYWRLRAKDIFHQTFNVKLNSVTCRSCDEQLGKEDVENDEGED